MITYIIRRTLEAVPTLLVIAIIVFILLNVMPGNVALLKGSGKTGSNPELINRLEEKWGLNDPLPIRFFRYLGNLLQGDLGYSIMRDQPTVNLLKTRIGPTFRLVLFAIFLAVITGIPLGFTAALKLGSPLDTIITTLAVSGKSFPMFWLGLMLMYFFGVRLKLLPTMGYGGGNLIHLLLPAISLGTPYTALIARTTRGATLDIIHEDFIRTARSKGLWEWGVRCKHILRNSILPVITVIGLQFGSLLAGTVVIEKVFILPGIGTLLIDSMYARDIPVVQAIVILIAITFVVINLLVDVSYAYLDPRIRYE